ncbi:hypothetical protein [Roseomonas indoligenes]|uniref:Uncharacterized protein n=1 Tax=Roseomonas indoligenes TaxID=2820811 RepID=A0A940S5V9_9PROT|nr:hypothetical protein [Pararoseomonas indoligenes]MBP0491412.1 hypothetical protein [Pararoseomonas indoligenes]
MAAREMTERRQRESVRTGVVLGVGFGTLAFLGLALFGISFYVRWIGAPPNDPPRPVPFPEPRLQADSTADMNALRGEQSRQMEGYAWIDRNRGLVRIPVARAMEILAARGAAGLDPLEAPPPEPLPVRPDAVRSRAVQPPAVQPLAAPPERAGR